MIFKFCHVNVPSVQKSLTYKNSHTSLYLFVSVFRILINSKKSSHIQIPASSLLFIKVSINHPQSTEMNKLLIRIRYYDKLLRFESNNEISTQSRSTIFQSPSFVNQLNLSSTNEWVEFMKLRS